MIYFLISALVLFLILAVVFFIAFCHVYAQRNRLNHELRRSKYLGFATQDASAVWQYDYATKDASVTQLYHSKIKPDKPKTLSIENYREALISDGTVSPVSAESYRKLCGDVINGADHCSVELQLLSRSGSYKWYSVYGMRLSDESGQPVGYVGQVVPLQDKQIRSVSNTKLYTRYRVQDIVNSCLSESPDNSALLLVDIDYFHEIKNTIGAQFSDALILELGESLKKIFPDDSIIGCVGYDQFVIFFEQAPSNEKLAEYAHKCCGCLSHCFLNNDGSKRASCSVGIALSPESGTTYKDLHFHADTALVVAKHSGHNKFIFYSPDMDERLEQLESTETAERKADASAAVDAALAPANLLSQSIGTLFESSDLNSAINLVLSLVGIRLDLDLCGIMEFSDDGSHLKQTYFWSSDRISKNVVLPTSIPHVDALAMNSLVRDGDSFMYCKNVSELNDAQRKAAAAYIDAGISSFMQSPIRDSGGITGLIGFGICESGRTLTWEQLDTLELISKILSGYLRQLRTKQDIQTIGDIDRLTGTISLSRFFTDARSVLIDHPEKKFAIIYADIDSFKFINENYGYKVGDDILRRIAQIISSVMTDDELLSHIGADKFVGLFEYTSPEELDRKMRACDIMINSISKTDVDCYKLPVRAGIYVVESGETDVAAMVDKANLARTQIHSIHRSSSKFFNQEMKTRIKNQKEIEAEMSAALERGEFLVYFQPKISLADETIAGVEALVRWNRPGYGIVPPDEFIPIFEENRFIVNLDFYVFDVVCRKLRRDIDNRFFVCPVSVNFSRIHLKKPDFVDRLREGLKKYDIPASLIEIEITETALIDNEDYLVDVIQELHDIGFAVAMDDFGSGYSSLNLLERLPVDVLKIDKNFLSGGEVIVQRARHIIANVINLAKDLDIRVVSEGVETPDQAQFLKEINCDLAQGFLYAQPMDIDSYEQLYQRFGNVTNN